MGELAVQVDEIGFLHPQSGELLPATLANARTVLEAIRDAEFKLGVMKRATTAWVAEESQRQGAKTLHVPHGGTIELTGGPTVEYDPVELTHELRVAGCAEELIAEIVKEEISYKVDRRRLGMATAANPAYRAATERVGRVVEKPWRAAPK